MRYGRRWRRPPDKLYRNLSPSDCNVDRAPLIISSKSADEDAEEDLRVHRIRKAYAQWSLYRDCESYNVTSVDWTRNVLSYPSFGRDSQQSEMESPQTATLIYIKIFDAWQTPACKNDHCDGPIETVFSDDDHVSGPNLGTHGPHQQRSPTK